MLKLDNMKKIESIDILRIFLGVVFLSAGIYRIFNWQQAVSEFSNLKLESIYLPILSVAFEIIAGFLLILSIKTKKVLMLLTVFLSFTLFWTLIFYSKELIANSNELFIFNITPTDFFLHLTYLIIVIFLFKFWR